MINELDLAWVPNFLLWVPNALSALRVYLIFETKFSWNEGIDTCFNIECVLLDRNFDFLGSYLVLTARYLVVTPGYCTLPGGYWWLLLVTARYCSFPRLVWTSIETLSVWCSQCTTGNLARIFQVSFILLLLVPRLVPDNISLFHYFSR